MKKDVYEYFIQMQQQYNDMNKVLEKVNKEIEEGKVSIEQRESFENYFNIIRCNYERISYIIHLLKQPPKFIRDIRNKKIIKEQEEFFKKMTAENATLECVKNENEEALKSLKESVEE